jgi:predicted nucleotidyltransferase
LAVDEKLYHLTPKQRESLVSRLTEILQQEPTVLGAWLHGSFHEGLPFHDIDVAVYLDPDSEAARDPLTLMLELGDHLERAVRLPVDVRVLNGAPLSFQFRATGGRPLLLRDEDACYAFVEHVRRMYWDFEPMIRQSLRDVLG